MSGKEQSSAAERTVHVPWGLNGCSPSHQGMNIPAAVLGCSAGPFPQGMVRDGPSLAWCGQEVMECKKLSSLALFFQCTKAKAKKGDGRQKHGQHRGRNLTSDISK